MTIRATYDGRAFVPEQPVDLPTGAAVTIDVIGIVVAPPGHTAADVLKALEADPGIADIWNEIAAGRESIEVARDLRQRAQRRER